MENLTYEKEKISKEIFDFCNIKWNENILKFYKRKDLFIKTLSGSQVRKKIFKYENEKYKPYFDLIKDLKNDYSWIKT